MTEEDLNEIKQVVSKVIDTKLDEAFNGVDLKFNISGISQKFEKMFEGIHKRFDKIEEALSRYEKTISELLEKLE